jgi:hypothetical protein
MEKFKYKVSLVVEVEAWSESDAWDAVQDAFGTGDNMGVTVVECEYKEIRAKRNKVV